MYNIPYFKEDDKQIVLQFVMDHPFGLLTGSFSNGKQAATQVPMLLMERDEKIYLQGHMMRNTDHHKAFIENQNALVVFTGPDAYVSASWYSDTHSGSTWSYMSVHMQGTIRFMSNDELIDLMRRLTLHFEKGNAASPTVFDNLSNEYTTQMLKAITGFEIEVSSVENVFKLAQNRDEKSYNNIIIQLQKQGGDAGLIADEMLKRKEKMFPKSTSV